MPVAGNVTSGVEAHHVSPNGDPAVSLGDIGNTAAPDTRSATEGEPPTPVEDDSRFDVKGHKVSSKGELALPLTAKAQTRELERRSGLEAGPSVLVADDVEGPPPHYASVEQCADLGGQSPLSPWRNPSDENALLPCSPETGAEESIAGAHGSEAGAQRGGADFEPQVAEDSVAWLHSPLLTQPTPWPPPPDVGVAATAAPTSYDTGGAAQVASALPIPDVSAQRPADTGEGYSYPCGDAAWDSYCYSYYCYYGYAHKII